MSSEESAAQKKAQQESLNRRKLTRMSKETGAKIDKVFKDLAYRVEMTTQNAAEQCVQH